MRVCAQIVKNGDAEGRKKNKNEEDFQTNWTRPRALSTFPSGRQIEIVRPRKLGAQKVYLLSRYVFAACTRAHKRRKVWMYVYFWKKIE